MFDAQLAEITETKESSFAELFQYWRPRCSVRAASALAAAECWTCADVAAFGRKKFAAMPNVGKVTLAQLAALAAMAGGFFDDLTPHTALTQTLALTLDPSEAEAVAFDCKHAEPSLTP